MNVIQWGTLAAAMMMTLGACAPKAESKKEEHVGFNFEEQVVKGPNLSGVWISQCHTSANEKRKIQLSARENQMEYKVVYYRDEFCELEKRTDLFQGTYKYKSALEDNIYRLEFIALVNGKDSNLNLNVVSHENKIFISELYIDGVTSSATISPSVGLAKIAEAKPAPSAPVQYFDLQAGLYHTREAGYCDLSISTAAVSGVTSSLYIDQLSPCKKIQINLNCRQNVCSSSVVRVDILSATQMRFTVNGQTPVLYEKM